MVVHNFNLDGFSILPNEADPVTVVDPDTVLAGTVFPEALRVESPDSSSRAASPRSEGWRVSDRFGCTGGAPCAAVLAETAL
jgi:hypothetical protein